MQLCAVSPRERGGCPEPPLDGWEEQEGLWVPTAGGGPSDRDMWREWCGSWAEYETLGTSSVLRAVLERSPRFGASAVTLLGVGRAELGQWTRIEAAELVTVAATLVAAEDEMDELGTPADLTAFAPLRRAIARGARTGVMWVGPAAG